MSILDFWWQLLICVVAVYLIANVNFAVILSKKLKKQDIRECGSGNPGTTNMLRTFGFRMGAVTFLLDSLKGILAALIGTIMFGSLSGGDHSITMFACFILGLAAVLGHIFPVFLKFKGGKGFATGVGFLAVMSWMYTLIFIAVAIILVLIWDYMSLGAIFFFTAQLVQFIITFFNDSILIGSGLVWWVTGLVILMWAVIMYAHRSNIARLLKRTENKSNFKRLLKKKKNDAE